LNPEELRATFEEVPELYEPARPDYPAGLLDDLVELGELRAGSRILEIGPGTAQATLPLAHRGFEIVGVELGQGLAAVARSKLAGFPSVEIVTANFESWEPETAGFDAVVAFTAFHWIDPELRYEKSARVLTDGGSLAVVVSKHILPSDGDQFFVAVQEDYDAVDPSEDNRPPEPPEDVPDLSDEIEASGRFRTVGVRRHIWDVTYSADEYIAVLDTYSGHRSMDEDRRLELFRRIRERIGTKRVRKTYLAILSVARKL